MMASTAALTGVLASASKRASSSSEPFLKWGFSRWNVHADVETGIGISSKPSWMWSFSTRTSMPADTDEIRVHHADQVCVCHCSLTDDFHTMDPLDRLRAELDEEMEERKMCGTTSSSSCKLVFLGGPGVGKGTWASLLSKRLNIPHISTGDLVRKELSKPPSSGMSGSKLLMREQVRMAMNQGKLLPDSIILKLLWNQLREMDSSVGFILDGFPRTVYQAGILDDAVSGIDMAVNFHLEEDALVAKCLGRRACGICCKDYNLTHIDTCAHEPSGNGVMNKRIFLPARLPPQECASKLKVRVDDSNEAAVRERLRLYARESEPLEQRYRSQGKLVEVDVGPGAEYVWPRLLDMTCELEHNCDYMASSC